MVSKITSKGIIGDFYLALTQDVGNSWIDDVSTYFKSTQEIETYAWLDQVPGMREWIGSRHAKGLTENAITIRNKKFESTMEIPVDWMRRDKTGQIAVRIAEMSERALAHWAELLTDLMEAAPSTACYDSQYFYDTDHVSGLSGTQSNIVSVDISALPVVTHGSTTAPSVSEFSMAYRQGIQRILGIKDNQGKPMNRTARNFTAVVPWTLWDVANEALQNVTIDGATSNVLPKIKGFNLSIEVNPGLTWTDKFAVFRTDSKVKSFIRQEELGVQVSAQAEGSPVEFTDDVHQYGLKAIRNVGLGYWQNSVLVDLD